MSNEVKAKGEMMIADIEALQDKYAEQLRSLEELKLWARVALQGIKESEVLRFGYDPLTEKRRHDALQSQRFAVYNYVELKTGGRVTLDPPLPVPPKKEPSVITTDVAVTVQGRDYVARVNDRGDVIALSCIGRWPLMRMTEGDLGDSVLWAKIRYEAKRLWKEMP